MKLMATPPVGQIRPRVLRAGSLDDARRHPFRTGSDGVQHPRDESLLELTEAFARKERLTEFGLTELRDGARLH
jgi:hypothetical protein